MREAKIIAKIENMEGLVNYREIMEQCDVMLLSRGSMGNCVDPEKMFLAQKMLLRVSEPASHDGKRAAGSGCRRAGAAGRVLLVPAMGGTCTCAGAGEPGRSCRWTRLLQGGLSGTSCGAALWWLVLA